MEMGGARLDETHGVCIDSGAATMGLLRKVAVSILQIPTVEESLRVWRYLDVSGHHVFR